MAMVVRRPRFGVVPTPTTEVSAFHMPGESWPMGAGQGCAPGYTEQEMPDGTWTCISAADFAQVQQGNFTPLVPIGAAPSGPVIFTPPPSPANPTPVAVVWTPPPPTPPPPSLAPPTMQLPPTSPAGQTLLPPAGQTLVLPTTGDGGGGGGDGGMPEVFPPGGGGGAPAVNVAFPSTVVFGGLALLAAAVLLSRKR